MTEDWEGGSLESSGKLDNPDYRCEHGMFIGDPYGPDYMCFYCEMGISVEEMHKMHEHERKLEQKKQYHLDKAKEHGNAMAISDSKWEKKYHLRIAIWHLRRYVDVTHGSGRGTFIGSTRRRYYAFKSSTRRRLHPIESAVHSALRERA